MRQRCYPTGLLVYDDILGSTSSPQQLPTKTIMSEISHKQGSILKCQSLRIPYIPVLDRGQSKGYISPPTCRHIRRADNEKDINNMSPSRASMKCLLKVLTEALDCFRFSVRANSAPRPIQILGVHLTSGPPLKKWLQVVQYPGPAKANFKWEHIARELLIDEDISTAVWKHVCMLNNSLPARPETPSVSTGRLHCEDTAALCAYHCKSATLLKPHVSSPAFFFITYAVLILSYNGTTQNSIFRNSYLGPSSAAAPYVA